jgi:membrane protein YqaA with SNARE-associated domain
VNPSIHHLLAWFVHLGAFGLFLLAVADDSFLFLPIGTDLLTVVLVARNHFRLPIYVLAVATGSAAGVFLLDLVCRKGGEHGLRRLVKPQQFDNLKRRMEQHAAALLVLACLAPPPFPFGAYVAAASAFQYPRPRLLGVVFGARTIRFALVGWGAIYYGRRLLEIASATWFVWLMSGFIAFCLIGSIVSIVRWVRIGRSRVEHP